MHKAAGVLLRRSVQHARAHHGRQRQRHHQRDDNGHRQGDGELVEQAANHIRHEQQRNQYRYQREGQRHQGKANLTRTGQRRLHRRLAHLPVPRHVLQHDDGVIHHKAGGDGQRHQRQVVDREVHQVHEGEGAHQRQWYRHAGDNGGRGAAQKREGHQHHQANGKQQFFLGIADRGTNTVGAVGQHRDIDRRRQGRCQLRQQLTHTVGDIDHIGPGLALHVQQHCRLAIGPGGQKTVLGAIDNGRHIAQAQRRTVLPGDDQLAVILYRANLVVGIEHGRAGRAVKAALGLIDVGRGDALAHAVQAQAVGRQRVGVDQHTQRRALPASQADHTHTGQLRQLLRHAGVDQVMHFRQRQAVGGNRQGQDGRIGRVDLAVDRRRGQVARQQAVCRVHGRLHFLLGHAQVFVQIKLQGDDRRATGTGR